MSYIFLVLAFIVSIAGCAVLGAVVFGSHGILAGIVGAALGVIVGLFVGLMAVEMLEVVFIALWPTIRRPVTRKEADKNKTTHLNV